MQRLKQKRLVSLQSGDSDTESGVFYYKCDNYDIVTTVFPTGCLEESVLHYNVFQNAYIQTRQSKKQAMKTFFVFDIENINPNGFSIRALKSFCDTHSSNRGLYPDILYGTFVKISDSGFLKYLLPFFEKFYTPIKPLRISADWKEMDKFVEGCIVGKLGVELATDTEKAVSVN